MVLIVDEAQNLAPDVLEQIRLLTNLETETQKLLQIILIGQPELRKLLAREDLRQLAQRITGRYPPRSAVARGDRGLRAPPAARRGRHRRHLHARRAARDLPRQRRHPARDQHRLRSRAARRLHPGPAPGARVRWCAAPAPRYSATNSRRAGYRLPRWPWPASCWPAARCCCGATRRRCMRLPAVAAATARAGRQRHRDRGTGGPHGRQRTRGPSAAATPASAAPAASRPAAHACAAAAASAPTPTLAQLLTNDRASTDTDTRLSRSCWGCGRPTMSPARPTAAARRCRQGLHCLMQRGSLAQLRLLNRPAILMLSDDSGTSYQVVLRGLRRRYGAAADRRADRHGRHRRAVALLVRRLRAAVASGRHATCAT